jgi:hypothetical protein
MMAGRSRFGKSRERDLAADLRFARGRCTCPGRPRAVAGGRRVGCFAACDILVDEGGC